MWVEIFKLIAGGFWSTIAYLVLSYEVKDAQAISSFCIFATVYSVMFIDRYFDYELLPSMDDKKQENFAGLVFIEPKWPSVEMIAEQHENETKDEFFLRIKKASEKIN